MSRKQVVVEILPGHIDVVIYDGQRRADGRRLAIDDEPDVLEWAKMIRRSGSTLRTIVDALDANGYPVTVLYRSPTQAVDLSGVAVRSGGQAVEAGVLSCTDSLAYSAMSAICEGAIVGRDAGGETRQIHVAVAAEREDVAEAIRQMVEEAGLKLATSTPLDAAVMTNLVRSSLRDKQPHQARLYIGEHTSYFVVTSQGTLLFSRRIGLGLDTLAIALTRPIFIPGRTDTVELDLDRARGILRAHGIPGRDKVVDEEYQLTGGQIIPPLQPVLQRYIVELRQSLRFGVSEEHRRDLSLRFTGPGASIPGLCELLSAELGVESMRDETYDAYEWSQPGSTVSELTDALHDRRLLRRLNLLPHELARQRRLNRLRHWLWTGAAAALLVIAVDGFRYHARLDDARRQASAYASQIENLDALQATGDRLRTALEARDDLEKLIRERVGFHVNQCALLQDLSRLTPEAIRFESIRVKREGEQTTGALSGFAFVGAEDSRQQTLQQFIRELHESPLFDEVELGNVHLGSLGTDQGQRFEARFMAVGVRRGHEHAASVVSAEQEVDP